MQINKGLMSSNTCLWETPQKVFDSLNQEFHFTTDVCAIQSNAKCDHYYSPEIDGLKQEWSGSCFMNPPYGKEIAKWVSKAYESAMGGQL